MSRQYPLVIELTATDWRDDLDFYRALLKAVGAPEWHGMSVDAFIDSFLVGDINAIEPPFTIRIKGMAGAPEGVRQGLGVLMQYIRPANAQVEWDILP